MVNWMVHPNINYHRLYCRYVCLESTPGAMLKSKSGIISASAHYLIFLRLNNQDVDSSIPQSWVTTISTALGRVFSLSLSVALGLAYTQLLWNKLRKIPAKVGTIDALFSMQANPLKLVNISVIKTAPLLWLAAAFLPIIPSATVFPPGAIVVVASA